MKKLNLSPNRFWLIFFGVWSLLLTGVFGFWTKSPGLLQWYRVEALLSDTRQEIDKIESQSSLQVTTIHQLENNSIAQEREIRKVLGYLGQQELVFEFNR